MVIGAHARTDRVHPSLLPRSVQEYGLKANKLTWPQIAAKLGFKKQSGDALRDVLAALAASLHCCITLQRYFRLACAGAVRSVGRTVDSRYGDGLFTQYSTAEGQLYQVGPL